MLLLRKNTATHPLQLRRYGDVALVLSLCCSTGVRVGAFGSESTLYMVYFITVMETLEDGIHCGRLLEEI